MNGRVGWGFGIFIGILVALHFVLRVGMGYEQLVPDLLVVALLLAARQISAGAAAGLGLILGILAGALAPFALGASALALTIVGYFGARSREFFSEDNYVLLALYLFVGKWAFDVLLAIGTREILRSGSIDLLIVSPLMALYAAAAGLLGLAAYRVFA
jgi:rod shape-determining protein MreD